MSHSVLQNVKSEDLLLKPYPHFVLHNALPPTYYEELVRNYPDTDTLVGKQTLKNNYLYLKPAVDVLNNDSIAQIWREFFSYHCSIAFYHDLLRVWGEVIGGIYPNRIKSFERPFDQFTTGIRQKGAQENSENKKLDIVLDCQFAINSPVQTMTSVRGPHTDSRYKLFAGLLYFRHPQDQSEGGELELYQYRDSNCRFDHFKDIDFHLVQTTGIRDLYKIKTRFVERVKVIPYRANTLVMWVNTPYSLHGVSPRSVTPFFRRFINFLGECYNGEQDGFFENLLSHQPWSRKVLDRLFPNSKAHS